LLFETRISKSKEKTVEVKSELIFNEYVDRYFLSQLFDEGSASGSKVVESRYEKKVSQGSVNGQEHASAKRRATGQLSR
jgi:hypothetical protein